MSKNHGKKPEEGAEEIRSISSLELGEGFETLKF